MQSHARWSMNREDYCTSPSHNLISAFLLWLQGGVNWVKEGKNIKIQLFFFYSQSILLSPWWGFKRGRVTVVLQIQFRNELFFSRAGAFCHMFTFYQLMPSWQFPWAMLRRWVINARWGGRKSIFHNLLFVSLTVVSISGTASLQESVAITSRLAINELYENVIIIIFSGAYQTLPGSSLLPFLNAARVKCIIYKCGFSSVSPPSLH